MPLRGMRGQGLCVHRPIMERGRVEIRAVGPDQRMHIGIDPHLIKNHQIAQWAEQFPGKDRLKVDHLFRGIIKSDA